MKRCSRFQPGPVRDPRAGAVHAAFHTASIDLSGWAVKRQKTAPVPRRRGGNLPPGRWRGKRGRMICAPTRGRPFSREARARGRHFVGADMIRPRTASVTLSGPPFEAQRSGFKWERRSKEVQQGMLMFGHPARNALCDDSARQSVSLIWKCGSPRQ